MQYATMCNEAMRTLSRAGLPDGAFDESRPHWS